MRLTRLPLRDMLGALLLLAIDQVSKSLVVARGISYVMNTGSIGGLFAMWHIQGWVWAIVSVVVLTALWRTNTTQSSLMMFGSARIFFTAGILGNFIDRVWYGAVIDFLDISIGWFHWPMFNVADVYLTIGATLMVGNLVILSRRTRRN